MFSAICTLNQHRWSRYRILKNTTRAVKVIEHKTVNIFGLQNRLTYLSRKLISYDKLTFHSSLSSKKCEDCQHHAGRKHTVSGRLDCIFQVETDTEMFSSKSFMCTSPSDALKTAIHLVRTFVVVHSSADFVLHSLARAFASL